MCMYSFSVKNRNTRREFLSPSGNKVDCCKSEEFCKKHRFNNGKDTMGKHQLFSIPRILQYKSPAGLTCF